MDNNDEEGRGCKIRKTIILSNIRELLFLIMSRYRYPYHEPWKDWETGGFPAHSKRPLTEPNALQKRPVKDRQAGKKMEAPT